MPGRKRYRLTFNGAKIARDMMRQGRTQRDVAAEAGVSETAVSRLVNGHAVGQRSAAKVATALGHKLSRYIEAVVDADEAHSQAMASLSA